MGIGGGVMVLVCAGYSRKAVRPAANVCSTCATTGRTTTTACWSCRGRAAATAVAGAGTGDGRRGSHRSGCCAGWRRASAARASSRPSDSYSMAKNFLGDSGLLRTTATAATDSVMATTRRRRRRRRCPACARLSAGPKGLGRGASRSRPAACSGGRGGGGVSRRKGRNPIRSAAGAVYARQCPRNPFSRRRSRVGESRRRPIPRPRIAQ